MHAVLILFFACTDDPSNKSYTAPPLVVDADRDGISLSAGDCDDTNAQVYPGATEVCDGLDNDCDAQSDEGIGSDWFGDTDGDGYGNPASVIQSCEAPTGFVADATDCDDTLATVYPSAPEICNAQDENCDGVIDEGVTQTVYHDTDGDGQGDSNAPEQRCRADEGYSATDTDCDDSQASIYVGAPEACNLIDDNCDGIVDEGVVPVWYADTDNDGWGDLNNTIANCTAPVGFVGKIGDCDDNDAQISPDQPEICDTRDNNCDGLTDPPTSIDAPTWYLDADVDGFGDVTRPDTACSANAGYIADHTDCNDAVAAINPHVPERCNGYDDNCDGTVDEDTAINAPIWYWDMDNDSYGDPQNTQIACNAPLGTVTNADDCDDSDSAVSPAATEICDTIDNDCDTNIDINAIDPQTWFLDADTDGYGNALVSMDACEAPNGYVADATDCDDSSNLHYPGSSEYCNGRDDNCDGQIDEAANLTIYTWYADDDSDGYGNLNDTTTSCSAVFGYVRNADDCDDTLDAVNPGIDEVCNGIDDNCDSIIDTDAIDRTVWYWDQDGDGVGGATQVTDCSAPVDYVDIGNDCDDNDITRYPGATEIVNGIDDDCDGAIDEATVTRFVALGDAGQGNTTQSTVGTAIATICARDGCDFALYLGDNIYPAGVTSATDAQFQTKFEGPYNALNFPFYVVLGNHDYGGGWDPARAQYQVDYSAYSSKWFMPDTFYTQTYNDITLFGFDTQAIYMGYGAAQTAWIPAELAAATTTWKIGVGHHPYLSNGFHGNAGEYDGNPGEGQDVKDFMDAYVCGEMDVYFSGHDHLLEWLEPTCGTQFIVSGSGSSTYAIVGTDPTYYEAAVPGFMWVEIDGNTFTGIFYNQQGVELYRNSFTK